MLLVWRLKNHIPVRVRINMSQLTRELTRFDRHGRISSEPLAGSSEIKLPGSCNSPIPSQHA
jgi:hypothetical protein